MGFHYTIVFFNKICFFFLDNGITIQLLKILSADLLEELCPTPETRMHLKKHIDDFVISYQVS